MFLTIAVLALAGPVAGQSSDAVGSAPGVTVVDGITINGPAPPTAPASVARDAQGRVTLRATRIAEPLTIDGRLDESVYQSTQTISGFIQTEPLRGAPASEETEVWIFYDADTIYVGARLYESSPEKDWVANEMRRDSNNIIRNDNFAIYFDTFYDRRNAFLFEVTPIGGIYDSYVTNERGPGNIDWNPIWKQEVGRFDKGWTAEMAIPFRSLRYKPGEAQVWGINMRRRVTRKNEESFIQRMEPNQGSVIFQISLGGTLVGIDAPSGSRNLEIKPYGIAGLTSDFRATPQVANDLDKDAGFDVKYGLTQNLTADFTYNTDFAQVEVDEQQVNLTRFPLFFPEKREFFLEGQGIFDFGGATASAQGGGGGGGFGGGGGNNLTPLLFFSRQIGLNAGTTVPIDVGGRLTGKVGKYTVGLIDVRAGETATTPDTNFSVVRVRRDLLRRSTVGVLFTGRSNAIGSTESSQSYGADIALGLYDNWTINGYYALTDTGGAGDDDTSYRGQVMYNGDRYGMQYERLVVGEHFNPQVGFLRRSAFARNFAAFRFSPRPRGSRRVRKYIYSGTFDYITDRTGQLETREAEGFFGIQFQSGDFFALTATRSYELLTKPFSIQGVEIPTGAYAFGEVNTSMQLGSQRRIAGNVAVTRGSFYDGNRTVLSYTGGRIELTPRSSVEPGVSLNFIDLPQGQFTTRLVSTRGTFSFTPRMFFTGLVQFNSSNHTISSNMRLRWEYSPGSELFVVYTDERDNPELGPVDLKNRAFVVKINRLLRF